MFATELVTSGYTTLRKVLIDLSLESASALFETACAQVVSEEGRCAKGHSSIITHHSVNARDTE